jgi:signal transduction histidine kinase
VTTVEPPLRILLVEDNPNDARLIRRHLSGGTAFLPDDIEVHHEESLDEGVAVLDTEPIDLLLLDLGLAGSSGAETFDRARERMSTVPVVVLTDLKDEATAVELLQAGAQDYINKGSLDQDGLVRAVRYALERQERERRLRTTTEQLEVLNRILRHDIQNDLQVIQMWGQGLLDRVEGEAEADLRRMLETSGHILELTENSREFMQAVAGESSLEVEAVRLDRVLRDELQKARSGYETAVFEVTDSLPEVTVAANGMLASVFRNLLNNAVQHNDGDAHVAVGVETDAETARVRVADDGPGVPDDRKHEIFGKGEYGLDSDGTGIGLYLVHTLVSEFDGRVWVEDNDPRGAVFVVELRRREPTDWT